ncbi:MAG: hypothetical protein AAF628_02235 [Planctomycetota bacterium]
MSRVVDRADGLEDWRALDRQAAGDPALWHELVAMLRQDATLRVAVRPTVQRAAGHVELGAPRGRWLSSRSTRWAALASGWLAAAVACMGWGAAVWRSAPGVTSAPAPHTAVAAVEPGAPQVLRELDRVVLRAEPTADGVGYDLVYLRRVLERARVPELFGVAEDEHGALVPTPVQPASLVRPTEF